MGFLKVTGPHMWDDGAQTLSFCGSPIYPCLVSPGKYRCFLSNVLELIFALYSGFLQFDSSLPHEWFLLGSATFIFFYYLRCIIIFVLTFFVYMPNCCLSCVREKQDDVEDTKSYTDTKLPLSSLSSYLVVFFISLYVSVWISVSFFLPVTVRIPNSP